MLTVAKIIHFNKMIDRAIEDKRFNTVEKYVLLLHKQEHKDKVPIGSYRIKSS
jgi:hypothetical protein